VAGVERRSVPLAHAQLIAWAVEVHGHGSSTSLAAALDAALRNGARPCLGTDGAELPEPPASGHRSGLSARIAEQLQRNGDLEPRARAAATPDEPDGMEL
jgi:hypothetical protein